jgi:hypothetical protein
MYFVSCQKHFEYNLIKFSCFAPTQCFDLYDRLKRAYEKLSRESKISHAAPLFLTEMERKMPLTFEHKIRETRIRRNGKVEN